MRILVTGATGNVGKAVIDQIIVFIATQAEKTKTADANTHDIQIFAGVRDPQKAQALFDSNTVTCVKFDFEDTRTMEQALESTNCQILFLVRPPHLANVQKYFQPLIDKAVARREALQHVFFLSVQGADVNKHIPHAKIEQALVASKIPYTFLRPAYFMQNFLQTPMFDELVIQPEHQVFLPAGNAKFTLIDVKDIGCAAAGILVSICNGRGKQHVNQSYDLTNKEQLSFEEMTDILNEELPYTVTYVSPNPVRFFFAMRRRYTDLPNMYIAIIMMLHYLPRFQSEPPQTNADVVMELCNEINGGNTTLQQELATFREFVQQHKEQLSSGVS